MSKPTKNRPVQFANPLLANGDDKENNAPKVDRKVLLFFLKFLKIIFALSFDAIE